MGCADEGSMIKGSCSGMLCGIAQQTVHTVMVMVMVMVGRCYIQKAVLSYDVIMTMVLRGGRDIALVKLGEEEGPDLGSVRWPDPALSNRIEDPILSLIQYLPPL